MENELFELDLFVVQYIFNTQFFLYIWYSILKNGEWILRIGSLSSFLNFSPNPCICTGYTYASIDDRGELMGERELVTMILLVIRESSTLWRSWGWLSLLMPLRWRPKGRFPCLVIGPDMVDNSSIWWSTQSCSWWTSTMMWKRKCLGMWVWILKKMVVIKIHKFLVLTEFSF